MSRGKKSNSGKVFDEKELILLNSNLKTLGMICSDLTLNLVIIVITTMDIVLQKLVATVDDSVVFNSKSMMVILAASFFLDLINYYFVFSASDVKHRNIYS